MENYKLIDNVALHQYEFRIGDLIPRIEYIKTKNGEIYLTHTEVPSALEGKGVGSSLVRAGAGRHRATAVAPGAAVPLRRGIRPEASGMETPRHGRNQHRIKHQTMKDTIEYSNGEITVFWQPARCRHAGICVKTLPEVYHPQEKPWIRPENATTEQLKEQIRKCPSGALSYKILKKQSV